MNNIVFHALRFTIPDNWYLPVDYQYSRIVGKLEDELLQLETLISSKKRAIDIGANRGLYTYALAQVCEVVEAFEPQPSCTKAIAAYSKAFRKQINIHNCALSSSRDELTLNIPVIRGRLRTTLSTGLASFQQPKCEYQSIQVPVHRLDDYDFQNVSFIKIDVEGHEREVIAGAKETITREKPVLQVEIEQRHLSGLPMQVIFDEIKSLGYSGYFLYEGQLTSLDKFAYEKHQKAFLEGARSKAVNKIYVNNFIFKPC
ncbi:MAG: FkbM family methyltransferase [Elainellaceae cyanobacterium]